MKFLLYSDSAQLKVHNDIRNDDEIHLFSQFFIHNNSKRNAEITYCLKRNVKNDSIHKFHLLNERIYTDTEMDYPNSNKIVQTNINKRLTFSDVFKYVRENKIKGYIVMLNIDIFLDKTIKNLFASRIDEKKTMFALLRYEYEQKDIAMSRIFGPRHDSQDTWIFHTNTIISEHAEKCFSFEFGFPGCDNKIIYLMKILGYDVINDPTFIKTYHYHESNIRNYTVKDIVPSPYGWIFPQGFDSRRISLISELKQQDIWFNDNDIIREYILTKVNNGQKFIIPRVAGIENNFAVYASMYDNFGEGDRQNLQSYFRNVAPIMKNNAGVQISTYNSIMKYSNLYLGAFENCELFCGWEKDGVCYPHIKESHDHIKTRFSSKKMVWAYALDVFHYIHSNPWTQALKGKRILIVSSFEESIREQIPNRCKLYDGVDLFPDCEFIVIKPPMTHGSEFSREFDEELNDFYIKLDKLKDSYDVALLSCGGYGNIISNHIFTEHNKSAIYMGGTLQMLFGILGRRWLVERPEVIRLYLNEFWTRTKDCEKPKGHEKIEGGCYW